VTSTTTQPLVKPRLRGVSHQWAAVGALAAGIALVAVADSGRERLACAIYAASVIALFTTSATYHRVNWTSKDARRWMRRLDHAMIFVLIAGTYTPFALLALHGTLASVILIVVWAGALLGIVEQAIWVEAPNIAVAIPYVALGWVAVAATPQMLDRLGVLPTVAVGVGGVLYTLGAVVYARQRPDPAPAVFGYHEIFHVLVILAAAVHYAVVAFAVLPAD
jgi:hemolysin III